MKHSSIVVKRSDTYVYNNGRFYNYNDIKFAFIKENTKVQYTVISEHIELQHILYITEDRKNQKSVNQNLISR